MFPAGAPGVGLALLRVSLAATLFIDLSATTATYAWQASALASFLFAGLLTPIVAALSGLLGATHLILTRAGYLHAGIYLAQAAAVALLGPGAYSVDARRFGRRRMRPPPIDSSSPSHAGPPAEP